MTELISLRLNAKTRQRIALVARRRRSSASEVIRDAIEAWVDRQEAVELPYAAVSDLLGIVRGGNPRRSSRAGRRLTSILKSRRRVR